MFKMIVYVSFPYTTESRLSVNRALFSLQKYMAPLYRELPQAAFVNALFSVYDDLDLTRDIRQVYPQARLLIDSADQLRVVTVQGYDYSPVVMAEAQYAMSLGKPVVFQETQNAK
jgi:hypothetical protein